MAISFHGDAINIGKPWLFSANWQVLSNDTPLEIAHKITVAMTSPCVWGSGVRKEAAFIYADWLGLDFDRGVRLQEIAHKMRATIHVIGTTKSHGKEKGAEPACDRFRVYVKLAERCASLAHFKFGARFVARSLGADLQAADAARMFMPCREIVSVNEYGGKIRLPTPESPKPRVDRGFSDGRVPKYVREWLESGVGDGHRNKTCFRIGAILTRCGIDEGEIVDRIMQSAIPIDTSEATRQEVANAVRSGARRESMGKKK